MTRIVMLTDYRDSFYSRMGSQNNGFDLSKLKEYFAANNFSLDILRFSDVKYGIDLWRNVPVLYTSLEDPELLYKSYIEDIVLGLEISGAWLLPCYYHLRAHHNKVFLEILRKNSKCDLFNNLESSVFGVPIECKTKANRIKYPVVAKPAAGANSTGVTLVNNKEELSLVVDKIATMDCAMLNKKLQFLRKLVKQTKKILLIKHKSYVVGTIDPFKKKFITQQYITNLKCDYKVLIYGEKYYILRRINRENDFRASGSGKFEWPTSLPEGMLNYARHIYNHFDVPYISLDIAFDGHEYYVLELQFIMFGTLTLEKSPHYFIHTGKLWDIVYGKSEIEKEFVNSICEYIGKKHLPNCTL